MHKLYAIKILRAHGMIDTVLQQVYRSVILSKLQYASCAWWGFTKASDRQRIDHFIRRSVKSGFCPADLQSFGGLCESAEENCLIRFCTIHYMFCISFFHVSLQQARITTSDHVNMIKNYQRKQLI